LARYGLINDGEPDLAVLCGYLSRERACTLRVLRRQPWGLLTVDDADTLTPAQVLHAVRDKVTASLTTSPPWIRRPPPCGPAGDQGRERVDPPPGQRAGVDAERGTGPGPS